MINKEELVKLRKGEWEFLSSKMTLTKTGNNTCYSGSGIIRQIKQKYFEYIIFTPDLKGNPKDALLHYFSSNKLRNGEIIPDSEKYSLTSVEGWSSDNLYPIYINHKENVSIITGYAHELVNIIDHTEELKELNNLNEINKKCTEIHPPKLYNSIPRIEYVFFEKLDFPANLPVEKSSGIKGEEHYPGWSIDALKFDTNKYQIKLCRENKSTEYTIKSLIEKEKLDDFIENRSIECLEFCLGRYVSWDIKIVYEGNIERIHIQQVKRKINYNKCTKSPLGYMHSGTSPHFAELYKKFLNFTLEDKISLRHSISKHLLEIYNSLNLEFNAQALTLPIQIEGLIHKYFANKKEPDKDLNNGIERIKELIDCLEKDLEISKEVANTAKQYLGNAKKLSISNILTSLKDKQVINERARNA